MDAGALIKTLKDYKIAAQTGEWDKVLAGVTLVSFGAAVDLIKQFPQLSYAAGALSFVTFLLLLRKGLEKAALRPVSGCFKYKRGDLELPSAIKGLYPFIASDGELFARLGRKMELARLLSLVRDDQIAISVVRGESGAGKTSLLQAGLEYTAWAKDSASTGRRAPAGSASQPFCVNAISVRYFKQPGRLRACRGRSSQTAAWPLSRTAGLTISSTHSAAPGRAA